MTRIAVPRAQPAGLTIGIDGRYLRDSVQGIGRYTYGLLSGLSALEDDYRVVVFYDPRQQNTRFPLEHIARSGKVSFRRFTAPLFDVREVWAWPLALRRTPVDVFHTPYFVDLAYAPMPCPMVATVHDMIFDRFPQFSTDLDSLPYYLAHIALYRLGSRLALRRATRLIAVSQATARDITRFAGTDPARISTVLSGVERSFRPVHDEAERRRVRAKYGLPPAYVLTIGVRRPHKNVPRLVAAFQQIMRETRHTLVLVGERDARFIDRAAGTIATLRGEGRLMETARIDEADLPVVYSMADLLVQPSLIEGFGFPVLEAMACGCPVACSNTTSLPEIAGDAAVLFDPRSVEAIAEALRAVLASIDLRCRLRERGLLRSRCFTWETMAASMLRIYRSAARAVHGG